MSYRRPKAFIFMVNLLCTPIVASVNNNFIVNVALNKHATQSSDLIYPGTGDVWSASNAVDGNKDCTNTDKDHFSGTASEKVPWWQVDLGNIYPLSRIIVYGRHDEIPVQLKGFQVYLLRLENSNENQHIYNNTNYVNGGVFTIPLQQNVSGRYVRIEMPGTYRAVPNGPLLICEVEVYLRECPPSKYGYNCNETCTTCTQMNCTYTDGECLNRCISGYKPTDRYCHTACDAGTYGQNCSLTCSGHHCLNGNEHCDTTNGTCLQGCDRGYHGNSCESKCRSGSYGYGCNETCHHCKNGTICGFQTGDCRDGCNPGFEGTRCDKECKDGYFGDCTHRCHCNDNSKCSKTDGVCTNNCDFGWTGKNCSIDLNLIRHLTHVVTNQTGVYETFGSSKAIDGKDRFDVDACNCCSVTNGAVPSWWQIDLGNKYLIDTVRIYGRADIGSSNDQLEHATIYASNYTMVNSNTTQKYIFEIPTITTTTVFTHHMSTATIAQFFTVKGLKRILTICEFKLFRKACDVGRFGTGCNHTCYCSDNNSCDAITGKCQRHGCFPGWRGESCDLKCESRSIGEKCSHTCHCINQTNCDNVNGHCVELECDPGWKGASCETKCESRSFGQNCSHTCHCINQTNCDNVNGHCEKQDCDPGWKGASCDTKCDSRSFGQNCSQTCHCINQSNCDNINGFCEKHECDPGWKGASCKTKCESKSFGKNCSHTCHCINQTNCDNVKGHCEKQECDPGWKGASCDTNNNILYRLRYKIKTSMSTVAGNWTSDRAVDGDTGPDPYKCQCCSGTTNEPLSWWMVDLGERVPVHGITIYSRNNENDNRQLQGFQVILSGDTSYNASAFMSKSLGMFSKMYVIKLKDILTRFIKIQRPGILTLCEVKVFQGVCEQGKFGHECSRECHCGDNNPCNQLTGSCQSSACKPGWQGPSCNETCPPETFGDNCSDSCYCAEGTCTNNYGICLGRCRQGYHGAHCNQVWSEVKSDTAVLLGVVGGGGAFLVGAVIIGIVVLKLRRRNRESVKSEYETPNRRASQTEIQEYDTIGNVTDSPAYENETATGL